MTSNAFSCFKCGDGSTPLYCLNCAENLAKAANESLASLDVEDLEQQLAAEKARADKLDEAHASVCRQLDVVQARADKAEAELFREKASQQMCVGAAGIGDFSELCGWIDGMKQRVTKAEAAFAEMRQLLLNANAVLRSVADVVGRQGYSTNWGALANKVDATLLSENCVLFRPEYIAGTGWLSPEVKAKVRGVLSVFIRVIENPLMGEQAQARVVERALREAKEALALLDKEGK